MDIQVYNEHVSKALLNSLVNGRTGKDVTTWKVKESQLHGVKQYWQDFTKTGLTMEQ